MELNVEQLANINGGYKRWSAGKCMALLGDHTINSNFEYIRHCE